MLGMLNWVTLSCLVDDRSHSRNMAGKVTIVKIPKILTAEGYKQFFLDQKEYLSWNSRLDIGIGSSKGNAFLLICNQGL